METIQTGGQVKSFFTTVFVTLGVILVIIVLAVSYFVVADPFHVKQMLFGSSSNPSQPETSGAGAETAVETPTSGGESFILSESQKEALRGLGIDPATVPSTITPPQVACFEEKLGADRVSEIRAGGVPSTFELFKVKSCIN